MKEGRSANAPKPIDISLILNIHNESGYLRRTLMSLEKATRYAQAQDIAVELVAVLDRPDTVTADWVQSYDFGAFDAYRVGIVDNGSLGPSRNDGIQLAHGKYIATCDADDLISYNFYAAHYAVACAKDQRTIVLPEYCYAFGSHMHLYKILGTDEVSKLSFFGSHPYISRIFAHRSLFDLLRFYDLPLTAGFAYEDWHLHCEAIAHGYEFANAKGTVFYYRQRRNSLVRMAHATSTRNIPFTRLLEPQTFVRICASDYAHFVLNGPPATPASVREEFLADDLCVRLTHAANEIDPAIDISAIVAAPAFANVNGDLRAGAIYYELCKVVAGRRFTDIVLLPALPDGVGDEERYLFGVLGGIKQLRPEATVLILTGERGEEREDPGDRPEGAVCIDLSRVCERCDDDALFTITLRLIQAVAPGGRLHIGQSRYACEFFRRYGRLLSDNLRIYYRFGDPVIGEYGLPFKKGTEFDFLSGHGEHLDIVLTGNSEVAKHDRARLDTLAAKLHTLHACIDGLHQAGAAQRSREVFLSRLAEILGLSEEPAARVGQDEPAPRAVHEMSQT